LGLKTKENMSFIWFIYETLSYFISNTRACLRLFGHF
jgi:hypothetical protein